MRCVWICWLVVALLLAQWPAGAAGSVVLDFDEEINRIEFVELAVALMRGYGAIPYDLTPAEVAIGEDIMVRQPDGYFHYQSPMPRWEMAVALSRLLDTLAPMN